MGLSDPSAFRLRRRRNNDKNYVRIDYLQPGVLVLRHHLRLCCSRLQCHPRDLEKIASKHVFMQNVKPGGARPTEHLAENGYRFVVAY